MSITMRKMFTLIEMMIVIVVLGILAAIVIPNVSDQKEKAITSMIKSNIRILQTAVDDYSLHHDGDFPTEIQPTLDKPQYIDIERLYPDYIKSKPDLDKEKNQKYWIDSYGKVWGATVDSPSNLYQSSQFLEWKNDKDVVEYNVYDAGSTTVTSRANPDKISLKQSISTNRNADVVKIDHITDSNVLLSSVDKYGLESAPVGLTYEGYQDWFQPLIRKTGIFTFELTNAEMMYWDAFKTLEDKPEGTSITYKFATINEKGEYSAFVDDFYSLSPANGIKVRVEMKGSNGKLPSIYDMRVIFHFNYEKVAEIKRKTSINLNNDDTPIESSKPVIVEDYFTIPENTGITKVVQTDSYSEFNPPALTYYYGADNKEVHSLSDIPSGSTVTIKRSYQTGEDIVIQNPVVILKENVVVLNKKSPDPELANPEWKTVQTLTFYTQSGDGQATKWLNAVIEDTKPENTRILYRYSSSTNTGWDAEVSDILNTSPSRSLRLKAYLQIRTAFAGSTTAPSVQSVKIEHERGLVIPSLTINPILSNNQYSDYFSTTSNVEWTYQASNLGTKKVINEEWSGDKRTNYSTPGVYEVKLRVQYDNNEWSNLVSYKFEVKQEQPVAVISTDNILFEAGKPITWKSNTSYDPDGDGIEKVEWGGDYQTTYTIGNYTVRLRVQDKEGNWSNWVTRDFEVSPPAYKMYRMEAEHPDANSQGTHIGTLESASDGKYLALTTYPQAMSNYPGYINYTFEGNGFDIGFYTMTGINIKVDGKVVKTITNGSNFSTFSLRGLEQGTHTLNITKNGTGSSDIAQIDYIDIFSSNFKPTILDLYGRQVDKFGVETTVNQTSFAPTQNMKFKIYYKILKDSHVTVQVKDENNNKIKTILSNTEQKGGSYGLHSVSWDGKSDTGEEIPTGNYNVEVITRSIHDSSSQDSKTLLVYVDNKKPAYRAELENYTSGGQGIAVRANASSSGGKYIGLGRYTSGMSSANGYINFTFNGTGFDLAWINAGQGSVYLDGKLIKTLAARGDFANPFVYSVRNLTKGNHTIKVIKETYYDTVDMDYIDVYE